jgi:hypothetical protein
MFFCSLFELTSPTVSIMSRISVVAANSMNTLKMWKQILNLYKQTLSWVNKVSLLPKIRNKYSRKRIARPQSQFPHLCVCGNWDWGCGISFLGIHKWDFCCSVGREKFSKKIPVYNTVYILCTLNSLTLFESTVIVF